MTYILFIKIIHNSRKYREGNATQTILWSMNNSVGIYYICLFYYPLIFIIK